MRGTKLRLLGCMRTSPVTMLMFVGYSGLTAFSLPFGMITLPLAGSQFNIRPSS